MKDADDRFGFTSGEIAAVVAKHRGLIRAGTYIPTRMEVLTLDPKTLHSVLIDWWWECPTELIPSDEQVAQVVEILKSRPDADSEVIRAIIAEAPATD